MNRLLHLQCTKRYLRRSCTNSSLFMKNNNNIENKKRMPNYIFDKKSYNKKVLNNPINKHKQYHLPSLSIVNDLGRDLSSEVKMLNTDVSISKNWPAELFCINNSENTRGLGVFCESQHGVRKATGMLFSILFNRSTLPW